MSLADAVETALPAALDDLARAMARRNGLDYYEREELDGRFADLRAQLTF